MSKKEEKKKGVERKGEVGRQWGVGEKEGNGKKEKKRSWMRGDLFFDLLLLDSF